VDDSECQHATISLLMDANPEFSQRLTPKSIQKLLTILEHQVEGTVNRRNNAAAAAAVVPILSVLYKFCQASDSLKMTTKDYIFPYSERYEQLLEEQKSNTNMSPLDSPKGSLRGQMCQLLTWPESHIKRFAGELLWVLCDKNSREFIQRVGMGNGMPILHSKGVVQLPSNVYEQ
jgi:hypothetical protein